ncbi:MAG: response regulator [Dissulfurispiraceae bacterium]
MDKAIRILLIEDNPGDARLLEEMLKEANVRFELECVNRLSSGIAKIKSDGFHIILLDLGLPDSQGLATLTKINEIRPEAPIIVLTGLADEAVGIQAVKEGAQDFLVKGRVDKDLLARSINFAIERKKIQGALLKSEELIKNILEHVDEGFIIIDRDFRILSANMTYSRMVEMPLEQITGKHCYEVSHHISAPCVGSGNECPLRRVFETRKSFSTIHKHENSKGRTIYCETKAYPFSLDPSGEVITAIETLVDVTEKQKLEDQLRQSLKMEAIGQLAGGVAHDFNNILTAIMGYGSLALMNMAKDDPQRINIEQMLDGAEKAAHLTKDLLLFSRKQISEKTYVDLNEIIKKMEKFLTRIIGEDISCKTMLQPGAIPVLADAHHIEQVLMNLATNARDAMPQGGVLSVTTDQIWLDKEFMTTHGYVQPGMYAMISVSDTGKGMDEATRQRIFEPFFTTKEMGRGTGLGLAVVYGIVKGHDGYINIYSEPELGTTFKIYLPLKTLGEGEVTTESIQPLILGKGETILIAEDDPGVRKVLRLSLEEHGYSVIEAENGEDAVKQYKNNRENVSLVLLDVIMPVKNGKETYDEIKSLNPYTKVIFMSGYTDNIIMEKGLLKADTDLILKPITPDRFLRKVREVLDR